MNKPQILFEKFLDILDHVNNNGDQKMLKVKTDDFNYVYKKSDFVEQGEYHFMVHIHFQESV